MLHTSNKETSFRPQASIGASSLCFLSSLPNCAKIWAYALPDPRVVTIECVPPRSKDYLVSCKDRIPSTLLVNRESRDVALKRYSLSFLTFEDVYGPPVYFDFGRDIVFLKRCNDDWWTDFNNDFNTDLSSVKRVIIQNGVGRPSRDCVSRTTPFYNMDSLGLVRHTVDPWLRPIKQLFLFCDIKLQITRAKEVSGNAGVTEAKLRTASQIYFLSWADVVGLELGESLWES